MGTQKNHLCEAVLLSTHNLCFSRGTDENNSEILRLIWSPGFRFEDDSDLKTPPMGNIFLTIIIGRSHLIV